MVKLGYVFLGLVWLMLIVYYLSAKEPKAQSLIHPHNPKLASAQEAEAGELIFYGYEDSPIMVINAHGLIFLRGQVIGYDRELGEVIARNLQK